MASTRSLAFTGLVTVLLLVARVPAVAGSIEEEPEAQQISCDGCTSYSVGAPPSHQQVLGPPTFNTAFVSVEYLHLPSGACSKVRDVVNGSPSYRCLQITGCRVVMKMKYSLPAGQLERAGLCLLYENTVPGQEDCVHRDEFPAPPDPNGPIGETQAYTFSVRCGEVATYRLVLPATMFGGTTGDPDLDFIDVLYCKDCSE